MMELNSLSDIVGLQVLQDMQDAFSDITRLAIIIVDYQGKPITNYSNFTPHCQYMRNAERCRELCFESDAVAGTKASRKSAPHIFTCYSGLVDMAIPIVFQDRMLGSILAGQVRVKNHGYKENVLENKDEVGDILDLAERKRLFQETPILTKEEVEKASKMIHVFCNYIVEIAVSKSAQRQLTEKNQELKKEMDEKLEMEKILREAEVKILKAQVNPHFFFNILNNIKNLSMIENAPRTTEMVFTFTDMLRYTMGVSKKFVTIGDEIDYARSYLQIQKMRFGENLTYDLEVDESLLGIPCPYLIIQPLVANSIDHGIFHERSAGHIRVRLHKEDDLAVIEVEDDGVGMDQEMIDHVFSSQLGKLDSENGMGIGLMNIHRRLQYAYGEDWGLKFASEKDAFTRVRIEIPENRSLNDYDSIS